MSEVVHTSVSNETLHRAFQTIDTALWEAVESPAGGIDRRTESLAGCVECLDAYVESRRQAFDTLLHDQRFWGFPLSVLPAKVVTYTGDDETGNQRADQGNKPIVAAFGSRFAPMFFFLGALVGCLLEIALLHLL